jgi:hypothetical protein
MGLLQMDSVPELNTKNLANSPNFLTKTHMTLSTKRFRSYKILMIDIAAEFCFWTEQWLNGSSHLGLGLPETPEVPNTKLVRNSLRILMVHKTARNG